MNKLQGRDFKALSEALRDAYRTPPELQRMLKFQMDLSLFDHTPWNADYATIVFDLLQHTESHNITGDLVLSARSSNPKNVPLLRFAQKHQAAVEAPGKSALEAILNPHNIMFDVVKFRERLGEIEGQVCRIELAADEPLGTGFLLGPDVIMTNWHVMKGAITDGASPDHFTARFGYKKMSDGTVAEGTTFKVKEVIDSSPPTSWELNPSSEKVVPTDEQMDYALIRVEGKPGFQSIQHGETPDPEAPERGWIKWPSNPETDFDTNKVLFVVQHPKGRTMKLTANTVDELNVNNTRVKYQNDTEEGSSGSPCFNANWDLVALHHSGDPAYFARFNQGIPLQNIHNLLKERDLLSNLGNPDDD